MKRFFAFFAFIFFQCFSADAGSRGGFTNISSQVRVGKGENSTIGFVLNSSSALILIRALGPSFKGSPEAILPDPVLILFRENREMARNDDWQDGPNFYNIEDMRSIEKRFSALPVSEGSKDSVILEGLSAGAYTISIEPSPKTPKASQSGTVLVEVFQIR